MDSCFVHTFSKHGELGSEGWNEFKKAYGFKLHVLVDAETKFPIALCITNGLASDNTLAIPLLKKAKPYLKRAGYILADKGYDDTSLIHFIVKEFSRKAAIPMRKKSKPRTHDLTVGALETSLRVSSPNPRSDERGIVVRGKLAKGKKNRYGNLLSWQLKAIGRIFRKSIYNKRTAVERTFSMLKRKFHLGKEETRGILAFAKNAYLSLICYMLSLFNITISI